MPASFAWTPVSAAAGYRLEIDSAPGFAAPVISRHIDTAGCIVSDCPVFGRCYWRVTAVDDAAEPQAYSATDSFHLKAPDYPRRNVASLLVGIGAAYVALSPDGNQLWAAGSGPSDSNLYVYDPATLIRLGKVPTRLNPPTEIVVSPDNRFAYSCGRVNDARIHGALVQVRTDNLAVYGYQGSQDLNGDYYAPIGPALACAPHGEYVLALDRDNPQDWDAVYRFVVPREFGDASAVKYLENPVDIVAGRRHARFYVTDVDLGLVEIEAVSLDTIRRLPATGLRRLKLTADDHFAFLADAELPGLRVIDIDSFRVVDSLRLRPEAAPHAIALSPDERYVFLGAQSGGRLSVVDIETLRLVETIDLGEEGIRDIECSPDGRRLYVAQGLAGIAVLER